MSNFRIDNRSIKAIFREEDEKRDMESSGRLHHNGAGRKRVEDMRERGEILLRDFKGTFFNDFLSFIKDTEVEGIFGDVNSSVEHGNTSIRRFSEVLSLISILPNGRSFKSQSTNW